MMSVFTILVFLLYLRTSGKDTFRLKGISKKYWLWMFLLCISQFLIVSLLYGYPVWIGEDRISSEYFIFSFYGIFCRPIVQEILFRGLMQKQLSKNLPPWLAISITTIASVIAAGIVFPPNMLPALCTGIFLGIIYHKTDKLILCMVFRGLYSVMSGTTRPSVEYVDVLVITFFLFAVFFTFYAIRGLMKENALPERTDS